MKIINRRAYHDYQILEKIEAGIELTGSEVKSIRNGRLKLDNSFVRVKDLQAFLLNAYIPPYQFANQKDYQPERSRKLLLHKKETFALMTKMRQKRLTLIPLSCYTKGPWIKVQIALAKGKKRYEKKEAKRKQDIARELERELRG